jgi:polyhydroxyalkanoate synthesis regulator phasin
MPADTDPEIEAQTGAEKGAPDAEDRPIDAKGDEGANGGLGQVQRGLQNIAFALERDRAAAEETIEGLRAEVAALSERVDRAESGELRDIKRGLRELTAELEQDRALFEGRMDELRDRLEAAARADDLAALRRDVHEANESVAALREPARKPRRFGGERPSAREDERNSQERPGG